MTRDQECFPCGGRLKEWLRRWLGIRLGVLRHYPPRPMRTPARYTRAAKDEWLPRISIVTPSRNQGRFLERTIASVLDQDYPHLEYVVQDGASTDDSVNILRRHSTRLHHWESCPDDGQAQAVNLGFRHTSGEIMAYLNSDDVYLPGTLRYVGRYFARHPDIDVVYGQRVLIDEGDAEIGRWVLPPHDSDTLGWADYVPQETLFWRRRIWDAAGGAIDESFQFALDWDLLLRFRDAGARFRRLPRFLAAFRIHPAQKTSSALLDVGLDEMRRLCLRCHRRPISEHERQLRVFPFLWRHVVYDKLYRVGLLRY